MTRARNLAAVAITLAWWSPTIAIALILMAPRIIAVAGAPYRIRRAWRLIDRGRVDEADCVIAALRRDRGNAERWPRKTHHHC